MREFTLSKESFGFKENKEQKPFCISTNNHQLQPKYH